MLDYLQSQSGVKASCPSPARWLNHQCPSVNPSMPGLHHEVCIARGEELMTVPVMSRGWNVRDVRPDWVIRVGTEITVYGRPVFAFVSCLLFFFYPLSAILIFWAEHQSHRITNALFCSTLSLYTETVNLSTKSVAADVDGVLPPRSKPCLE